MDKEALERSPRVTYGRCVNPSAMNTNMRSCLRGNRGAFWRATSNTAPILGVPGPTRICLQERARVEIERMRGLP